MSTITIRGAVLALSVIFFSQSIASAQDISWAEKMFDKRNVDLGVVARGADVHYYVKIKNIYKEDVHISDVRTTCGCTAAEIKKRTLKTHETATVDLEINTRKFMRRKNTNVIITFDQPLHAEVRIPLTVYIRSDVVLSPGGVEFGNIDLGQGTRKSINVAYSGRSNWSIKDVKNKNPNIDVKIEEKSRIGGSVNYELTFDLKPTCPAGRINQQVTLVTDDATNPYVPVLVKGTVKTDIRVTPSISKLGSLEIGKEKKFFIILTGEKPFSVTNIECESANEAFKVILPKDTAKKVFRLPLSFTAPDKPGKFIEEFTITVAGRSEPLKFRAMGEIKPGEKVESKSEINTDLN